MRETAKHIEAFEYYVALGLNRSLYKVARKMGVSTTTACKWSVGLDWQNRVEERDVRNGAAIAKKTDSAIVKETVTHTKAIRDSLNLIRAALGTAVKNIQSGELQVTRAQDLASLTTAQKELIKLDLVMSGEADSRVANTIKVEHCFPPGHEPRKAVESEVVDADNG